MKTGGGAATVVVLVKSHGFIPRLDLRSVAVSAVALDVLRSMILAFIQTRETVAHSAFCRLEEIVLGPRGPAHHFIIAELQI